MTYLIFMLAIAPLGSSFLGFLIGKKGDRHIRDRLLDFYIAVHGDWKALYQGPASLTASYMRSLFGRSILAYVFFIFVYSLIATAILTALHLNLAIPDGVDSAGPILTGDGGFDFETLVLMYLAPNLMGDLVAWTLSLWLFSLLSKSGVLQAVAVSVAIMLSAVFSFVFVARLQIWDWQSVESFDWSIPSVWRDGGYTTEYIRLSNALFETGLMSEGFTFDYWGAVPAAVFLPAILLSATILFGVVAITLRRFLERPLTMVLERLDADEKPVMARVSLFLIGAMALVTAIRVYILGLS